MTEAGEIAEFRRDPEDFEWFETFERWPKGWRDRSSERSWESLGSSIQLSTSLSLSILRALGLARTWVPQILPSCGSPTSSFPYSKNLRESTSLIRCYILVTRGWNTMVEIQKSRINLHRIIFIYSLFSDKFHFTDGDVNFCKSEFVSNFHLSPCSLTNLFILQTEVLRIFASRNLESILRRYSHESYRIF